MKKIIQSKLPIRGFTIHVLDICRIKICNYLFFHQEIRKFCICNQNFNFILILLYLLINKMIFVNTF